MSVTFNHSILAVRDRHESARFLAEVLGLAEPTSWGPFTQVRLDGGVFIQFAEPPVKEIQMQHYAFLVDDERFDEILGRIQARGIPYTNGCHRHPADRAGHGLAPEPGYAVPKHLHGQESTPGAGSALPPSIRRSGP